MADEKIPYKCSCGGNLRKTKVEVEFFGIDFGLRDAEVCIVCGSEYGDKETKYLCAGEKSSSCEVRRLSCDKDTARDCRVPRYPL